VSLILHAFQLITTVLTAKFGGASKAYGQIDAGVCQ